MAVSSANVNVRVEQDIKDKAAEILARIGISTSTIITMTNRQVILKNSITFTRTVLTKSKTRDTQSKNEFHADKENGKGQAKAGESSPFVTEFDKILEKVG